MKGGSLNYRPRIDGLRFVAIGLVLIEHFGWRANYFEVGYYGVDLFFVISGYLITAILLKNPLASFKESYRAFMGRRILRIFPIYYLLVLLLVAMNLPPARELSSWLMTYTFNYGATWYARTGQPNPWYYLWSLSVEEQFYLLWPLLVLALRERRTELLGVTTFIIVLSYAQITFQLVPAMNPFNYTGLFNRMGSLGLGALGAIYVSYKRLPDLFFRSLTAELAVILLLCAALVCSFRLRFVLMGLCSLFLVIKAAHFDFRVLPLDLFLGHRWVVYVGSISYGIYLFHVPLGNLLIEHVLNPLWKSIPFDEFGMLAKLRWHSWLLKLPLCTALSIAIAALSYRWLETPILSLKDRWFAYRKVVVALPSE
jgi:peptidoglycan/LPS O-acetylase OafA/YrhL